MATINKITLPNGDSYDIEDKNAITQTDVLTKTNTTSYTPSGNYNPATKKYVDDKSLMVVTITSSGSGDNITYSANKTFTEIYNHISNSNDVIAIINYGTAQNPDMQVYSLSNYSSGSINFHNTRVSYLDPGYGVFTDSIAIYNDNSVYVNRTLISEKTFSLAINSNVIQLKEGSTVISSITLPVYNGGVSS